MSQENTSDVRSRLAETKYFTLRPKPLEQWLWQRRIPATAERLYWLHWEEGMRNGTWCSEVALSRAAATCCVDISTVTRAYQRLQRAGLIRRANPGHDPRNPFQQAITVTEVLVPRELATELDRHPNRPRKAAQTMQQDIPPKAEPVASPVAEKAVLPSATQISDAMKLMSEDERVAFYEATRTPARGIKFSPQSRLNGDQQRALQAHIASFARVQGASNPPIAARSSTRFPASTKIPFVNRLEDYYAARLRKLLLELKPMAIADELCREVIWSIENGALAKLGHGHAINTAIKKIKENQWTRPNKMPPNWRRVHASPEVCVAA